MTVLGIAAIAQHGRCNPIMSAQEQQIGQCLHQIQGRQAVAARLTCPALRSRAPIAHERQPRLLALAHWPCLPNILASLQARLAPVDIIEYNNQVMSQPYKTVDLHPGHYNFNGHKLFAVLTGVDTNRYGESDTT